MVRRLRRGTRVAALPDRGRPARGVDLLRVDLRRPGARLPAPGGGLSRQRHQRCVVRPHSRPLSAFESSGDAGDRDTRGDRPCCELRDLGHGRSVGPRARCERPRSPDSGSEPAGHERRAHRLRPPRRLGGDAGGDRDSGVRRPAAGRSLEITTRGVAVTRVGVDVGGTFTDLVAVAADGAIAVHKVATTPEDPAVGMFRAIESMSAPVELLVHGTTIATNALLERRGARVVLVTTRGFEDLLWLRRQDRAALYDLARDHPPPLVARGDVLGVAERMGPTGVLQSLADAEVERVVAEVQALAPQSVAVAFLFAFRHPEHERRIAAALRGALGESVPVAASHEVLPVFREFERVSTTTAEAYLRPKVATYLAGLDRDARSRGVAALRIMTSAGGTLAPAAAACRTAALALSGPAGGVVGARLIGAAVGLSELLTLDMGGTSADASLVTGGAAVHDAAGAVAGIPLALPSILIETVSAGGGSIARVDEGGALKVGPERAGAVPG